MNLQELNDFITDIDNIRHRIAAANLLPYGPIEWLHYDLVNFFRPSFAQTQFNNTYKQAWVEAVTRRFDGMAPPIGQADLSLLRHRWRASDPSVVLRVLFGQMRVGPSFQGALNVHQQNLPGLPDLAGRAIDRISDLVRQGKIFGDQIPIQIFHSNNRWVAANNRGLTTYALAGTQPARLIPRLPQQAELNRLAEVEGQGGVPQLQYAANVAHLAVSPRTLPSNQMPITTGPNTWIVQKVATIPDQWG